jgi:NADH-quinone oxidoreductase subunit D
MSTTYDETDPYAGSYDTTEGRIFTITGGDWDSVVGGLGPEEEERLVVNMGPQHPSTGCCGSSSTSRGRR